MVNVETDLEALPPERPTFEVLGKSGISTRRNKTRGKRVQQNILAWQLTPNAFLGYWRGGVGGSIFKEETI